MPIKIPFLADVRDFLRGTGDAEDAIEEIGDALDDMAREATRSTDKAADSLENLGDDARDAGRDIDRQLTDSLEDLGDEARDAGRDLERRLSDATREAGRDAEKMERTFTDSLDKVKREAKDAGETLDRETTQGMTGGREAVGEFRNEATQNFSEVASSFSGDMDSAVDLVQGTLGGLAGSIPGGIGLALAGLGATAGAVYTQWNENAEKIEDRIKSMYEDMLESGNDFLSADFVNQGISDIINDSEDAVVDFARAQEIAERTGISLGTVLRAYAGDAEAASEVNDQFTAGIENFNETMSGLNPGDDWDVLDGMATPAELRDYQDSLNGVSEATGTAGDRAAAYRDAQVSTTASVRDYTEALAEMDDAQTDALEAIAANNDEISDQADRTTENNAVLAGYASELIGVQDAARDAGASTAELNDLQSDQYDQFLATASAAGIGASEADALARQLGLIPDDVGTDVNVSDNGSTSDVQDDINNIHGTDVSIGAAFSAAGLQAAADAAARRIRPPAIQFVGRIGQRYV